MAKHKQLNIYSLVMVEKWRNLILLFIFWVNSYFQVEAALLLGKATNSLIAHNFYRFEYYIFQSLLLWLLTILITFFQSRLQRYTINKMETHMRWSITNGVLSQSYQNVKSQKPSVYASWLQNDVQLVEQQALNSLYLIMRFSGNAFFATFALIRLHWSLAITSIFLGTILITLPRYLKKLVNSRMRKVSEVNETFMHESNELFENYDSFFSFSQFKLFRHRFSELLNLWNGAHFNLAIRQAGVNAIVATLNILSQILLLGLTGYLAWHNYFAIGFLVSVSELGTKVFDSLGIIVSYWTQLASSQIIFEKYPTSIKKTTLSTDRKKRFENLSIKNGSFSFNSEKIIIINENLTINRGDKFTIIGESGIGKSTLLEILSQKIPLDSGNLFLNNNLIGPDSNEFVDFGFISLPQFPELLSDSFQNNILFGNKLNTQKYKKIINILELNQKDSEDIDLRVSTLSGGQKQRIALARAIYQEPQVLLLDEALSAINEELRLKIITYLNDIPGLTLIMVTHHFRELPVNFKIYKLANHRLRDFDLQSTK